MATQLSGCLRIFAPRISQIRLRSTESLLNNYPSYIKTSSPDEWNHVTNLFPKKYIPNPSIKTEYPSGWKPQTALPENCQYFIERNKNHMLPIYLDISRRGTLKITIIKRIHGDIWLLKNEITEFFKERYPNRNIRIQLHEVARQIQIKGDWVNLLKEELLKKGF